MTSYEHFEYGRTYSHGTVHGAVEIIQALHERAAADPWSQHLLVMIDKELSEKTDDIEEAAQRVFTQNTLPQLLEGDWREVFSYANGFFRFDVEKILHIIDGENDGDEWVGVFRLRNGQFAGVRAGCDYTGWG